MGTKMVWRDGDVDMSTDKDKGRDELAQESSGGPDVFNPFVSIEMSAGSRSGEEGFFMSDRQAEMLMKNHFSGNGTGTGTSTGFAVTSTGFGTVAETGMRPKDTGKGHERGKEEKQKDQEYLLGPFAKKAMVAEHLHYRDRPDVTLRAWLRAYGESINSRVIAAVLRVGNERVRGNVQVQGGDRDKDKDKDRVFAVLGVRLGRPAPDG